MDSDQELNDMMDQIEEYEGYAFDSGSEDDWIVNEGWNQYIRAARDRGRQFQRNLIEQSGGNVNPEQEGRLDFDFERVARDHNKRFNINATRYKATMRQSGNFIENQDLSAALRDGLKRSIDNVLKQQKLTQDHRVFFHVFSDRFHGGHFHGMGLTVRDWQRDT